MRGEFKASDRAQLAGANQGTKFRDEKKPAGELGSNYLGKIRAKFIGVIQYYKKLKFEERA